MIHISPDTVKSQLERILASPEFMASKRLSQFLRYVVEQSLNGQSGSIKEYTVGVEALLYGANFDPQSNPSVRVHARKLRRALDQYYLAEGNEDPIRIDIPKGRYVPAFTLNNGSPQEVESVCESQISIPARIDPQDALQDGPSIAILPFEYLGNEPENAFIASGITEEIIIALTRFQEFLVIGPLDRNVIRQKHLAPRAIGQEYNVRFLLDGTVRLRGRTFRLTTKLTDTHNGRKLWGQALDYDIETTSVDQVEKEIVGRIVAEIADNFGVIPRTLARDVLSHHDKSLSDYEAVLKFHHYNRTLTERSMTEAIAALEKTVQGAPENDLAMALLADLVGVPYFMGYVDDTTSLERAETLARKALALNPNSQQAHYAMAQIHYQRFDKAQCLMEIEQILELNPNNANYLAISALFLMGLGQKERSLELMRKSMHLNPHHPGWYHVVPFLYHYYQGEYETALFDAKGFNTPDYFWDPLIRTAVLGQLGHQEEAEKAIGELLTRVPDFETRGHSLIQRMVYLDENIDMLVEGLHKAGLEIQSEV